MDDTIREDSVTVGATSTELSADHGPNVDRADLAFTNTGAVSVSLGLGSEAEAGKGIVLAPGAVTSWSMAQGYPPMNRRVTAFGNGGVIAVYERLIPRRSR